MQFSIFLFKLLNLFERSLSNYYKLRSLGTFQLSYTSHYKFFNLMISAKNIKLDH